MNQLALDSQPTSEYRIIPLTQGQVTLVDALDYEHLSAFKWYARWDARMQSFYAHRNGKWIDQKNNKREPGIPMHRQIMGLLPGDPRQVDHRNSGQTLDNRRFNLRIVTQEQNKINRRMYRNNSSGFKGVVYNKRNRNWMASIQVQGKSAYLGSFPSRELAFAAYRSAAQKFHGEFANLGNAPNLT